MGEKMFCGYEPKTSKMSLPRTERAKKKKGKESEEHPLCGICFTHHLTEKLCFFFLISQQPLVRICPTLCEMFWYASITATWLTAVIATWDPPEPKQLQGPVFL